MCAHAWVWCMPVCHVMCNEQAVVIYIYPHLVVSLGCIIRKSTMALQSNKADEPSFSWQLTALFIIIMFSAYFHPSIWGHYPLPMFPSCWMGKGRECICLNPLNIDILHWHITLNKTMRDCRPSLLWCVSDIFSSWGTFDVITCFWRHIWSMVKNLLINSGFQILIPIRTILEVDRATPSCVKKSSKSQQ